MFGYSILESSVVSFFTHAHAAARGVPYGLV
jgi:hypothetical protein